MDTNKKIFTALIHYPVFNKNKEIVATSVTTLDLHDISRTSRTYGLRRYYVVTPIQAHKRLVERIVSHWMVGHGAAYNPTRTEAFTTLAVVEKLEEAVESITLETGTRPKVIVTGARKFPGGISYNKMKEVLNAEEGPFLILFGTGWGLADLIVDQADYILEPIQGGSDYNHLPVRAAFAIIIDRLLGI